MIWVISPYASENTRLYAQGTYSNTDKIFEEVWNYDLKNGTVALGNSYIGDSSKMSESEIKQEILKTGKVKGRSAAIKARQLWILYNEIKLGDIVVARKGISKVVGFGMVAKRNGKISHYSEKEGFARTGDIDNPHANFLNVDWREEVISFDRVRVFNIDRIGTLEKIVVDSKYEEYASRIKDKIKLLYPQKSKSRVYFYRASTLQDNKADKGRLNMKKDRKTISIKLRFATEDLFVKNEKGKRYRACWDSGFAYIEANKTLGIKSNPADIFHNLEDIVPIIKKILRKQKIMMVSDNKKSRIK